MNKKFKRLNIFLAGAACCASLGLSMAFSGGIKASAATSYSATSIFTRNGATVAPLGEGDDAKKLAFTFSNDTDTVSYHRDLAWKWYEASETDKAKGEAKYLSIAFSLEDKNFSEFALTLETASLTATEKNKITNKIVFTASGDAIDARLDADGNTSMPVCTNGEKKIVLTIANAESGTGVEIEGEYNVIVNGITIGSMKNVGSDYAGYVSDDEKNRVPLSFSAKLKEGQESTVCVFESMNGQSFALNDSKEIEDTAAPVLVIDDTTYVAAMGQTFALETKIIDVLDRTSSVKNTAEYFQWSPVLTEAKYQSLDSVKILEMQYEKDGKTTSVYDETFDGKRRGNIFR